VIVHPHVAGEVEAGEFRQIETVMQDRPKHPVGEAVVIFLVVGTAEIGGEICHPGMLHGARGQFVLRGDLAAPAEPKTVIALEERSQRDLKAAGSRAAVRAGDGDAVGHHHYPRQ
jgi:hypothetical protein